MTSSTIAPPLSEEAFALAFADRHVDKLRFVGEWGRWMIWDGRRWQLDHRRKVFSLARELWPRRSRQRQRA